MIKNPDEVCLPPFQLPKIVDEESTIYIHYRTTARFTTARKFMMRYIVLKTLLSASLTSPIIPTIPDVEVQRLHRERFAVSDSEKMPAIMKV